MTNSESPQDLYAKNLQQTFGYPLRYPEPKPGLPVSYAENGLHIGDVGYVDEDGRFIVQFNICFPLDHDLHRARREDLVGLVGLTTFDANETSPAPNAFPPHRVICHGVQSLSPAGDLKHARKFMPYSKSGAILALPSGALLQKLNKDQEGEFRKLAEEHALRWCQVTRCTSLYLITGFYKTSSWYLASFRGIRATGQAIMECDDTGGYTWDPTCDYRQSPGDNRQQNQAVIISGFKIQVREWDSHIWVEELPSYSSIWSNSLAFLASSISHILVLSWMWIASGNLFKLWEHNTHQDKDASMHVNHTPAFSQPFHPSDIINHYLLHKNPNARVAITHDSQWLAMLIENEISHKDMVESGHFWTFLEETYRDGPDSMEVAYLWKKLHKSHSKNGSDLYKLPSPGKFSFPPVPNDAKRLIISYMRVENSVTCLRRMPVGFYILVQFNGTKIHSKCKPALLNDGPLDSVVEWDDEIMLPTDLTVEIELSVHASFEFEPLLGNGEVLYIFKGRVDSLVQIGNAYLAWSGEYTPCASLFITFEERQFSPFLGWSNNNRNSEGGDHSCIEVAQLTDKGHSALLRFHRVKGIEELNECIESFSLALDCCPIDHKFCAVALFNFATAKFISCQVHGTTSGLKIAITSYRRGLQLRPHSHPDRPRTLLHLAQALLYYQGKVRHEALVADEIKKLATEAKQICSRDSYDYRGAVLVLQTLRRHHISTSRNFEAPVSELDWSARAPPSWCLDRPHRLVNLGIVLRKRFENTGRLDDLENSISVMGEAMQLISDSHPLKPMLTSLGNSVRVRFAHCGVVADLDNAIVMIEDALKSVPRGHLDRPWMLASLGNALRIRSVLHFGVVADHDMLANARCVRSVLHRGAVADLDSAIAMIEDAVKATPDDHFDKPWMLVSFGNAICIRFLYYGVVADLDDATAVIEDAVKLAPCDHPDRPWMIISLCNALRVRFARRRMAADLDNAIAMTNDVVKATPDDHFNRSWMLAYLGNALCVRFGSHGVLGDLDNAIAMIRDAVKATPGDHFIKPFILASLSEALHLRFERCGIIADSNDAISMTLAAIKLCRAPDDGFCSYKLPLRCIPCVAGMGEVGHG